MRNKLLALLAGLIYGTAAFAGNGPYLRPINVATTVDFHLYNADGTLDVDEADGGTEVSLSCAEGNQTTATNDFVDEGDFYSIALTQAEMNCARIAVIVAATDKEVFFIDTFGTGGALGLVAVNMTQVEGSDATDQIRDSVVDDATRIDASELNQDIDSLTFTVAGDVDANTQTLGGTSQTGRDVGAGVNVNAVTDGTFVAADFAGDFITAAKLASDVTTELQSGLATASNVSAVTTAIQLALGVNVTTIATLSSQTSFTLTAGSADDNAYNGWAAYIRDASTATQVALGKVSDYTGSTKTVTLAADPGIFTMAATDNIVLMPAFLADAISIDVADFFTVDSGETAASAVAGSVVAEIGDLAAGGGLTEAGIADAVMDEALAGHTTAGTVGKALSDTLAAVDTEVAAIKAKTDNLPSDPADDSDLDAQLAAINAKTTNLPSDPADDSDLDGQLSTIAGYLDTEIAAIKAKTDSLTFTVAGNVDANVQRVNDVVITGDGSGSPFGVSFRSLRRQLDEQGIRISYKETRELRRKLNRSNGAPQTVTVLL